MCRMWPGNKGSLNPVLPRCLAEWLFLKPMLDQGWGPPQWESLCLACLRAPDRSPGPKQFKTSHSIYTHTHTPSFQHSCFPVSVSLPHEGFLRNEVTSLPTASVCSFLLFFFLTLVLSHFIWNSLFIAQAALELEAILLCLPLTCWNCWHNLRTSLFNEEMAEGRWEYISQADTNPEHSPPPSRNSPPCSPHPGLRSSQT